MPLTQLLVHLDFVPTKEFAEKLIQDGRVRLCGAVVTQKDMTVASDEQDIQLIRKDSSPLKSSSSKSAESPGLKPPAPPAPKPETISTSKSKSSAKEAATDSSDDKKTKKQKVMRVPKPRGYPAADPDQTAPEPPRDEEISKIHLKRLTTQVDALGADNFANNATVFLKQQAETIRQLTNSDYATFGLHMANTCERLLSDGRQMSRKGQIYIRKDGGRSTNYACICRGFPKPKSTEATPEKQVRDRRSSRCGCKRSITVSDEFRVNHEHTCPK
jgi:hypothetical protein